ncbi:hypothetical protein pb186bvf_009668 [Paramecium bursaria]
MNRHELMKLKPEKRIQQYGFNMKAVIGKGSYGIVFVGKDMDSEHPVAIKVIDNNTIMESNNLDLLQKEIDIMKKLQHSNIVQLIDVFQTQNNTYLISEYCNGPDLRQFILQKKSIPEEQAIKYIKQIINGVKEIINGGFIHRDLKPANIVLNNNICKITDFGFSRPFTQDQTMESLVGTPLYMAPQILTRQPYTSKCDIWSIGLIFYEMIYGRTPWMANNFMELIHKIQNNKLQFPKQPQISIESQNFIMGCLQKEESKRFDWKDLFNHVIIRPKMNLLIDQAQIEIFKPSYTTHRIAPTQSKPALPGLPRERSCSTNNNNKEVVEKPIIQQVAQQQGSSQSTECEDHNYYLPQKKNIIDKMRRTRSQLENIKTNNSDINNMKKNQQMQTPMKNIVKQTFTSKHFKNITNIFQKGTLAPQNQITQKDYSNQLLSILSQVQQLEQENTVVEIYVEKQRGQVIKKEINYEECMRLTQSVIKQAGPQAKKFLTQYLSMLQILKDSNQ